MTRLPLKLKALDEVRNYLIDTTSRLVYQPFFGAIEAAAGFNMEQILSSRGVNLCIDAFMGRAYGIARDIVTEKVNPKTPLQRYLVDTLTAAVLNLPVRTATTYFSSGADLEKVIYSVLGGSATVFLTTRLFTKFVMDPWRNYWNYNKYKNQLENDRE
jgi:hypothetical protein